VLCGMVELLASLGYRVVVYAYLQPNHNGRRVAASLALIRARHPTPSALTIRSGRDLQRAASNASFAARHLRRAGTVVYISADSDATPPGALDTAARLFQPHRVLAVVHNTAHIAPIKQLVADHPGLVTLLTLTPHTAAALTARLQAVALLGLTSARWLLPTLPVGVPNTSCLEPHAPCAARFTVQGNLNARRRNYTQLLEGMQALRGQLAAANVRLQLIGSTAEGNQPLIPAGLEGLLTLHANLGFREFYTQIQTSLALLPAVAGSGYLDGTRITSTVITSLITGVPMLADSAFMRAYRFLPAACFYEQREGESEAAAMLRVARMGVDEHALRRANLVRARDGLQLYSARVMRQLMEGAAVNR
jgi:hypothetical protein